MTLENLFARSFVFFVFSSFCFGTFQRFWHVVAKTMQKPRVTRCGGAALHLARFIVADGHAESIAPDLFSSAHAEVMCFAMFSSIHAKTL